LGGPVFTVVAAAAWEDQALVTVKMTRNATMSVVARNDVKRTLANIGHLPVILNTPLELKAVWA
jgi:hypothetical protein